MFLLIPLILVLFALGVVAFFQLVSFSINFARIEGYMGEWFNTGNFWAWVVGIILFAIVTYIFRLLFMGVRIIIMGVMVKLALLLTEATNASRKLVMVAFYLTVAVLFVTAVALAFYFTGEVVDYSTAHPEASDIFVEGNWFGYVVMFCFFMSIFYSSADENS